MKKIFSLAVLFVLTLTLMAVPAMADTYDFNFTSLDPTIFGNGTLSLSPNVDGTFTVLGATGTVDGLNVTGILGSTASSK